MSYCRFSEDSDVYIMGGCINGEAPRWECCGCLFKPITDNSDYFYSLQDLETHLNRHKKAGHKVPSRAFKRIHKEMNYNVSILTRIKNFFKSGR